MSGLVERLVAAALLAGALVAAYRLVSSLVLARARRGARRLDAFRPGLPGVLFFTTPDCVTCRAAQKPALRALEQLLPGRLQVIEVDASSSRLAKEWSVLSVPTTFILDSNGRPREVNHGYASADKLLAQLRPCLEGDSQIW